MIGNGNEAPFGISVAAPINVAIANTMQTITHPLHAVMVIVGRAKDRSIPEMVKEEETRMMTRRERSHQSDG